jgi:hypothetical protein
MVYASSWEKSVENKTVKLARNFRFPRRNFNTHGEIRRGGE